MVDRSPRPKKRPEGLMTGNVLTKRKPRLRPDETKPKFVDAVFRGEDGTVVTSPEENNPVTMLGLTSGDTFKETEQGGEALGINARGAYLPPIEGVEGGTPLPEDKYLVPEIYAKAKPNAEPVQIGDVVIFGEEGANPQTVAHEFMHRGFNSLRERYTPEEIEDRYGKDASSFLFSDRSDIEHVLVQGVLEREGVKSRNTYYSDLTDESKQRLDTALDAIYDLANESLGEQGFQTDRDRGPTKRPKRNVPEPSFFQKVKKLIGFAEGGMVDDQTEEAFGFTDTDVYTPDFSEMNEVEPKTKAERSKEALSRRPRMSKDVPLSEQVSQEEIEAGLDNAASFLVPYYDSGVNLYNVLTEYQKPEEERDYDYIESEFSKAGESAAVETGMLVAGGIAAKYGSKAVSSLAKKVQEYEFDPNTMSAFGVGAIRKKAPAVADDVSEAERLLDDPEALKVWQETNKLPESQRQANPVESKQAADELFEGTITSKEARQRIQESIPTPELYTPETMPTMPTVTELVGSLGKKAAKYGILGVKGFDLKPGQMVSSRLDIPAYNNYDKWVVSIHDGSKDAGSVVGFGQAIRLKNIRFGSKPQEALDIARGKRTVKSTGEDKPMGKSTIARIFGEYVPEDPYKLQEEARRLLADPDSGWTQVGMNPYRMSAFYDKATGKPVFEADEIIQVGPLVLAKNVKKATISQMKEMGVKTRDGKVRVFNEGGMAMDDQMQAMFKSVRTGYAEGGEVGAEQGTVVGVDPVSGNEVPAGSMPEEVRDDIPAMLSEGEYVVPADVVRYYGVKFFEDLRTDAKMGLTEMESNGRIGGEPVGEDLDDEEMDDLDALLMEFAEEGSLNFEDADEEEDQGFAVGGVVEPMGGEPTDADSLVERVMSAVQNNPTLQQELSSKGIQVSRTTPQMQPDQMGQSNPPEETRKAFADGGMSMTEAQVTSPTTIPSQFQTLGGSYFNEASKAPTPMCPDGFIYDNAKKMCVPDLSLEKTQEPVQAPQGNDDDGGPGVIPQPTAEGDGGVGFGDWSKEVDWSNPSGWLDENIGAAQMGDFQKAAVTGLGSLVGGPASFAISAAPAAMNLRNVAKMRAMQKVYEAAGMDEEASLIAAKVDQYVADSPKLVGNLDDIVATGSGEYKKIIKDFGLDPETATEDEIRGAVLGASSKSTPKPTPKPTSTPKPKSDSDRSSKDTQDLHKKIRENAAREAEAKKTKPVETAGASNKYVGRTDSSGKKAGDVGYKSALKERQEAKQKEEETKTGGGGGRAKGGLMVKKKK